MFTTFDKLTMLEN